MTMDVIFYEKPGCINNARQKKVLARAGYRVDARNLLTERWNLRRLVGFLAPLPVAEWFNASAPRIKNGEIAPERLSPSEAMKMLILDPILIRRPLVKTDLGYAVGFEPGSTLEEIGIRLDGFETDVPPEACPRIASQTECRV